MNCSNLECPRDCPVIKENSEELAIFEADLFMAQVALTQLEADESENRETASQLAKLPNSPETASKRSELQESIIETASAQRVFNQNRDLLNLAIEMNKENSEAYLNSCSAQPYYVEHPSNPGQMIITCASNYINEI